MINKKSMNQPIRIVTHNGIFHADELFAVAALELYLGERLYDVVRTRDPEVIAIGDYVVDVGMEYDADLNRFDHHQRGGAGERENGVPYSSFGLVWKKFGEQICGSSRVAEGVDRRLVQPIDMADNGLDVYRPLREDGLHPYLVHNVVVAFRPTWMEGESHDVAFREMVTLMRRLLEREIIVERDNIAGEALVERAYHEAPDKRLIVLEGSYPWHRVLSQYPEPLYVVKPKHQNTNWEIEAVRSDTHTFSNRKNLPAEWAGLTDGELSKVTGVPGSVFCHSKRYVAVAETKQATLELAQIALSA